MAKLNKNNNSLQPASPPQPPSPELLGRFLDLQQKELQLRTEELALRSQQEENRKSLAESSISANLQDRENERSHFERKIKIVFIGSIVLFLILVCFAGYALYAGKEEIVMKLVEITVSFAAGFAGGYGYKTSRQSKDKSIQD